MTLNVGDEAPDFDFVHSDNSLTNLHSLDGLKIIYFFPKAFTPGCTKESCSIKYLHTSYTHFECNSSGMITKS